VLVPGPLFGALSLTAVSPPLSPAGVGASPPACSAAIPAPGGGRRRRRRRRGRSWAPLAPGAASGIASADAASVGGALPAGASSTAELSPAPADCPGPISRGGQRRRRRRRRRGSALGDGSPGGVGSAGAASAVSACAASGSGLTGSLGGSSAEGGIENVSSGGLMISRTVAQAAIVSIDDRSRERVVMSSVIGGAMLPHAPQFFSMPETKDRATVERVRATAAEIGVRPRALRPDLSIIFSIDRAEQFSTQERGLAGLGRRTVAGPDGAARHGGSAPPAPNITSLISRTCRTQLDPGLHRAGGKLTVGVSPRAKAGGQTSR
jgi:hypothetical protein